MGVGGSEREWGLESGEFRVESGDWRVGSSEWRAGTGEWVVSDFVVVGSVSVVNMCCE